VRDIEQRIERCGEVHRAAARSDNARARGHPGFSYEEHIRTMFDLMALAFQTDTTRLSPPSCSPTTAATAASPTLGVPDAHHGLSHHQRDPQKLAKLAKIDQLLPAPVRLLPRQARRRSRRATGTLLDNSNDRLGRRHR
jgi:hypothetical protein